MGRRDRLDRPGRGRRSGSAQREDTEPTDVAQRPSLSSKPLRKISRELTEDELAAPGAQKLLIGELDRMEKEIEVLADYREQFHQADKARAVLSERLKKSTAKEMARYC